MRNWNEAETSGLDSKSVFFEGPIFCHETKSLESLLRKKEIKGWFSDATEEGIGVDVDVDDDDDDVNDACIAVKIFCHSDFILKTSH